jgi:GTP-binding protein
VNKWDLSDTTQRQYGPRIEQEMPFMGYCPVVFTSAKSGFNIRRTIEAIDYVAAQVNATLPTGILNRTIIEAYNKANPPAIKGGRLKIYYSTQTGVAPLRICLFVNNTKLVNDNYKRYLAKRIRARFGLEGAPLILLFRARKKLEFTKS